MTNPYNKDYEKKIVELISKLNESYKRVVDKKYLSLVTSDEQASFLRIFYRVNLDKDINFNEIKPGNEYLYEFNGVVINAFNDKLKRLNEGKEVKDYKKYIGFINKLQGYKTRYTFQMHNKITSEYYKKF